MAAEKNDYLLEEMKAARTRIDSEISAMNQFEVLSLTSIGAIYLIFFQYSVKDKFGLIFLSILPVLICVYGLFRYRAHASIIKIHEKYIKDVVERVFIGDAPATGLVGFYDIEKRGRLKAARYFFWIVVFLMSFAILITAIICPDYITRINPSKVA